MLLLQNWYGLSDYEVEDRVNDSISFSYFCGLTIEQSAPDHSTLSRFRTALTKAGAFEELFKAINSQLEEKGIIVKKGAIVDASVVNTPYRPKGKPARKVMKDREEEGNQDNLQDNPKEENFQSKKKQKKKKQKSKNKQSGGVDTEAAWLEKRGKLYYGYKKHYVTEEEGLVIGVVTTPANVNEISNLEEVLDSADLPEKIPLKADKGYQSKKNAELLKRKKLKNHILKRGRRNKKLSEREKYFNKLAGRIRFKVERTFGSIKRWFKGGVARYKGLAKMHTQNILEAICYNLYRSPGIMVSKGLK
jgi:IS5 family transposase